MNCSQQLAYALTIELEDFKASPELRFYTFIGLEDKVEAEYLIKCCEGNGFEASYNYYADVPAYKVTAKRLPL